MMRTTWFVEISRFRSKSVIPPKILHLSESLRLFLSKRRTTMIRRALDYPDLGEQISYLT